MPPARPVMPEPLELAQPPPAPAAGRARLLALALRLRELLTGHAGALGLIMSGPLDGPNAMRLNETLLESFMVAGLELDDAARAAYALQVYVLGSIALESADLDAESEAAEASDRATGTEGAGATLWTDLATFPLSERTESVAAQHNSDRAVHVGRAAPARRAHRGALSACRDGGASALGPSPLADRRAGHRVHPAADVARRRPPKEPTPRRCCRESAHSALGGVMLIRAARLPSMAFWTVITVP